MCNCNDTSTCNNCQNGQPCNCPPDYSVLPQPAQCGCCPPGYQNFTPSTSPNWTNGGYCTDVVTGKVQTSAVPCVPCEQAVSTNCVTYIPSEGFPILCNAFGIVAGDTLTTIINKMCITLTSNIQAMFLAIAVNEQLSTDFCQLVQACPSTGGSTTPLIGSITVSFP